MEGFADDVGWMCDRLRIEKPVMIGHSMGGIVAFDLACRYPTLPSAIVMLDAAAVLPGGSRAALPHLIEGLRGADYQEVQRSTWRAPCSSRPTISSARSAFWRIGLLPLST